MEFLVDAVQQVTSARLILDSPKARILERGLRACRQTPVLNALSLEPEKLNEILPLAAHHGTGLVLLLMDEKSITPRTLEEKIALALELRERALAAGIKDEDLIFDPVLPNLSWDEAFYRISECVKTVRLMASGAIFQEPVRTMVGLSNLRSGQWSRYSRDHRANSPGRARRCGLVHLPRQCFQYGSHASFFNGQPYELTQDRFWGHLAESPSKGARYLWSPL